MEPYEGPYFTIRVGGGLLYEGAWYSQDEESREQFDLTAEGKVRDARFVIKGRLFPKWKRAVTYSAGFMYDGPTDEFLVRETGIMVAVPELWGHIFVGRTKEGFSLNKVMVGYAGWTMERSTINDATIPILADGIKWLGYLPKQGILWNLGIYTDWLSEGQGFSTYDMQVVGRLAWLPIASEKTGTLLHLGVSGRYGQPNEGELKLRSRPEAFPAEYFVDTGTFACKETKMLAFEGYYRPGPLLVGTEYFVQWADAPEAGDPVFHGGDVVVTLAADRRDPQRTTRAAGSSTRSPRRRPCSKAAPAPGRRSCGSPTSTSTAATSGAAGSGELTPMVNWHLSDNVRLELAYGYGQLDRFDLKGGTQFFQSRIQLTFYRGGSRGRGRGEPPPAPRPALAGQPAQALRGGAPASPHLSLVRRTS